MTYPECISITTQTPKDYFGYVHIPRRPLKSSIKLKINGALISEGGDDGWELVTTNDGEPKYSRDFTLNVQNKNGDSHSPIESALAIKKSGYFLKVKGSSIYTNNDRIEISWLPSSNN